MEVWCWISIFKNLCANFNMSDICVQFKGGSTMSKFKRDNKYESTLIFESHFFSAQSEKLLTIYLYNFGKDFRMVSMQLEHLK